VYKQRTSYSNNGHKGSGVASCNLWFFFARRTGKMCYWRRNVIVAMGMKRANVVVVLWIIEHYISHSDNTDVAHEWWPRRTSILRTFCRNLGTRNKLTSHRQTRHYPTPWSCIQHTVITKKICKMISNILFYVLL